MIDLHIHTTFSDGRENVESVLATAEDAGAEIISITDHDSVGAYPDVQKSRKLFSGKIICGAELSCVYKGYVMEVLGYGIDTDIMLDKMKNVLHTERYFDDLISAAKNMIKDKKLIINEERFNETMSRKGLKYAIYNECLSEKANQMLMKNTDNLIDFSTFFRNELYDPKGCFFIDHTDIRPSAEKIASIIRECGGKSFMAHPLLSFSHDPDMIKNAVCESGIDGIECKYPLFNEKQTEFLIETAKRNNKFISGGSDYHGAQRPNKLLSGLDGNLKVYISDVSPWLDTVKMI